MTSRKITIGKNEDGTDQKLLIHEALAQTLDEARYRVLKRGWDYIAIIAGLPGSGKSTFARGCARYCCPWFGYKPGKEYIAFHDKDFIEITNNCPEYSSIILDESFASLNSRTTMTPEFLRIINHLQIIRQRHLFIFLCLPNFFDLAKGIAVFRTSHLFVTYPDEFGRRGKFIAFDRDAKRVLYIKGAKYMDYNASPANYNGRFFKNYGIIDEDYYDKKKFEHLSYENKKAEKPGKLKFDRERIIYELRRKHHWKTLSIAELFKIDDSTTRRVIESYEKNVKRVQDFSEDAPKDGEKP